MRCGRARIGVLGLGAACLRGVVACTSLSFLLSPALLHPPYIRQATQNKPGRTRRHSPPLQKSGVSFFRVGLKASDQEVFERVGTASGKPFDVAGDQIESSITRGGLESRYHFNNDGW